jgi:hypothetical protein
MNRITRPSTVAPSPNPRLRDFAVQVTRWAVLDLVSSNERRRRGYERSDEWPSDEQASLWEHWTGVLTSAESDAEHHLARVIQSWRPGAHEGRHPTPADYIDRGLILDGRLFLSFAGDEHCPDGLFTLDMHQVVNLDAEGGRQ